MKTRVIVGLVLTALLIGVLYFGGWVLVGVLTLFACIAVHEMGAVFKAKGCTPWLLPGYLFAAVYAILYQLTKDGMLLVFVGFLSVLLVVFERLFNPNRTTEDCFAGMGIVLYPLAFFAVLAMLGLGFDRPTQISALLLAFSGPLLGDMLAFFIGSFFGKHKLCPAISPKKTVEGSIASIFGGVLGGAVVLLAQPVWSGTLPAAILLGLGAGCGVVGQAGDLFASTIKRWAGVKDYGALFPGHGGVMDRVDSVLLCAPMILCCLTYAL